MNLRFEVESLKSAIDALLVSCPEMVEDGVLRADMLEGSTSINEVLSRILDLLADAGTVTDALSLRMESLAARKARYQRQCDSFRTLIAAIMERGGLTKLVLPEATLSISYRSPSPIIADEAALPDECVKTVRKPDMATIKAWCESGNMPAGVAMSNGKSVLSVRVK